MILPFLKASNVVLQNFYYKKMNFNEKLDLKLILKRYDTVIPLHINKYFYTHQGKTWIRCLGTKYHVDHKAGEFAATKKPFTYKSKKKKGR